MWKNLRVATAKGQIPQKKGAALVVVSGYRNSSLELANQAVVCVGHDGIEREKGFIQSIVVESCIVTLRFKYTTTQLRNWNIASLHRKSYTNEPLPCTKTKLPSLLACMPVKPASPVRCGLARPFQRATWV